MMGWIQDGRNARYDGEDPRWRKRKVGRCCSLNSSRMALIAGPNIELPGHMKSYDTDSFSYTFKHYFIQRLVYNH